MAMPQVMESDAEPGLARQIGKALGNGSRAYRARFVIAADQGFVILSDPKPEQIFGLLPAMAAQPFDRERRQCDAATTPLRLRFLEGEPGRRLLECPCHPERTAVEVKILPPEGKDLAATHTRREREQYGNVERFPLGRPDGFGRSRLID